MKTQISDLNAYPETLRDIVEDGATLMFRPDDKVSDILRRMQEFPAKAGGVLDARGNLAGLVTKSGILRRLSPRLRGRIPSPSSLRLRKAARRMTARDVMVANPDTLQADDTIEDAVDVMTYLSHAYMPVVDGKKLVGIVDTEALKRSLKKKSGALKSGEDVVSLYAIQQKLRDPGFGGAAAY